MMSDLRTKTNLLLTEQCFHACETVDYAEQGGSNLNLVSLRNLGVCHKTYKSFYYFRIRQ